MRKVTLAEGIAVIETTRQMNARAIAIYCEVDPRTVLGWRTGRVTLPQPKSGPGLRFLASRCDIEIEGL